MKAGYALAARDVKNWDRDVLARIGSSRMTPAHLARLSQVGVNGQVRPDLHAATSQGLSQRATNRMQRTQRQQNPTRNPIRQAARGISRWRDVRHGTKMVKAAMVLAAKEAKNADPNVRLAIGNDPTMTKAQISNMVQGQLETAFKPEAYAPRPGQQQGVGQQGVGEQGRQQGQGQGQRQQIQGGRVQAQPQRGAAVMQQLTAAVGSQAVGETEQALVQALAEFQRLQGEIKQLIETRMAQIQQENANLNTLLNQVNNPAQQVNQQAQIDPNVHNVGQHPIVRTEEPGRQEPEAAEPQAEGEQGAEGPEVKAGEQEADRPQVGDGEQVAEGAQVAEGPQVAEGQQVEGGEHVAQGGQEGTQPQVGAGADPKEVRAKEEAARAAAAAGDVAPVRSSTQAQATKTAESARQDTGTRSAGQTPSRNPQHSGPSK